MSIPGCSLQRRDWMNIRSEVYSEELDKPRANPYVNSDSKNEYDKHIVDS